MKELILLFGIGCLTWPSALGHAVPRNVENMNGLYLISNPNHATQNSYSTLYSDRPNVEYFDAYSPPISTRYGEVYWTMMDPVPLDAELVERFKDKTMAIVGYETDQVFKTSDGDKSVPITWAYNHHYGAYLSGGYSKMTKLDEESGGAYPFGHQNHGAPALWLVLPDEDVDDPRPTSNIPISQFFSEGNGGEFRKSYHGYPEGFAQFIDSPNTFHIQPMQIDTKNRHYNGTGFKPDLLPASSAAPPDASYSGLLECPCTTRIHKVINVTYATQNQGTCDTVVDQPKECKDGAVKIDPTLANAELVQIDSANFPTGCSIIHYKNGTSAVVSNKHADGAKCGVGASHWLSSSSSDTTKVEFYLDLDQASDRAAMNITGPDGKWFGVGLDATSFSMSNEPYAIIVDGTGKVQERKLGDHDGGSQLSPSVQVISNQVVDGRRTVGLTRNGESRSLRSFKGQTQDHYTFDPSTASTIPIITASGTGPDFAYHGPALRSGSTLHLTGLDAPTCVCNTGIKGTINGIPFSKNCLPEPKGDLAQQKNPTCSVDTYQGGLSCCHHENILLDTDQEPPEELLTYHLKFRFYFEPYEPATDTEPASHQNLIRLYWQTEALAGEYDVPKKDDNTPPHEAIHEITARWQVKDMVNECDLRKGGECAGNATGFDGVHLKYAGGHCHAPSCISMELFNADTGKLLCRHDPVYGESDEIFDELGYLALPPCLWGPEDEGLVPPTFLSFETNLISIKRNNNTYAHYGEMASWQMRGVLVKQD